MPDIGYLADVSVRTRTPRGGGARRAMLVGAIIAGMLIALRATAPEAAALAVHDAGPELTRLLRAMAGLKMLFAAGVLAAFSYRLALPTAAWRLALYAATAAAMAAGPVLIWQIAHVGAGALLLHGGLLGGVILLWRDPVLGAQLAGVIARRRGLLRARG